MAKDRFGEEVDVASPRNLRHDVQCCWRTNGIRCCLYGGMSPEIGEKPPRYCHWHYVSLTHAAFSNNEREFLIWFESWQKRGYKAELFQHDPRDVWDAIQGKGKLPILSNGAAHNERRSGRHGDRPAGDSGPSAGIQPVTEDEVPF
jgi:hypothetical protein